MLKEDNMEVEGNNLMIEKAIGKMKGIMIDSMIINTRKGKTEEEGEAGIMKIVIEITTIEIMKIKKSTTKIKKKQTILKMLKKMSKTKRDLNKQEIMVNSPTKDAKTEMTEEVIKKTEKKTVIILNAIMKMTEI